MVARKRESPSAGAKLSAMLTNQREERQDAVYNHRPYILTGPPVQIYNLAFVTFIREMSYPHTTLVFSDKELGNALEFIGASLDLYQDESRRRTKIDELRALGHLVSPEINIEARVIKPDGTTTVPCPGSEQDAIVRIIEVKGKEVTGAKNGDTSRSCTKLYGSGPYSSPLIWCATGKQPYQ